MTSALNAPTEFRPRSWILWLTWIYVVLFGIGTLFGVAALMRGGTLFGLEMRGPGCLPSPQICVAQLIPALLSHIYHACAACPDGAFGSNT